MSDFRVCPTSGWMTLPLYRPARLAQRGSFIDRFDSRSSTTKHQIAPANASNLTKICSSLPTHTKPANLDVHQAFGTSRAHESQRAITTPYHAPYPLARELVADTTIAQSFASCESRHISS
jgi:hypothetical protein